MSAASSKLGEILVNYEQVSFADGVRLSPHCTICGDVKIGPNCTVFAGAHVRGDCAPVSIGEGTNIQENCSLHVSGDSPLSIGCDVTVGHGAIVHGCTIEDNVLVGMGSVVMDHSHIGRDSLIAAGAVVTEGKAFPPKSLIMGVPARAVRELSDEEVATLITAAARDYQKTAKVMEENGLLIEPDSDQRIWP